MVEGDALEFTVTASPPPASALTVRVQVTEEGDMLSGSPPASVTIPARAGSATLAVPTRDDAEDEGDTGVTAEILADADYLIGTGTARYVVLDDDESDAPRGKPRKLRATVIPSPDHPQGPGIPRVPAVRVSWAYPSDVARDRISGWLYDSVKVASCSASTPSESDWHGTPLGDETSTERIAHVSTGAVYVRVAAILKGSGAGAFTDAVCADTTDFDRTPPPLPPPANGVGVLDARVQEGPNAKLRFHVVLDDPATERVAVDWATRDGSARAGSDYRAGAGTVTFAADEIVKTVAVRVLDDAHDEGEETMTLVLSNARGAQIREAGTRDGAATGTIRNSDPLPRALLARFGRTAAVHVVEQVEARVRARRAPGVRARFAGRELGRGMGRDVAQGLLNQLTGLAGTDARGAGGADPTRMSAMGGVGGATAFGVPGSAARRRSECRVSAGRRRSGRRVSAGRRRRVRRGRRPTRIGARCSSGASWAGTSWPARGSR